MGVEPTIPPSGGRIAGFEGREDHRTPFASVSAKSVTAAGYSIVAGNCSPVPPRRGNKHARMPSTPLLAQSRTPKPGAWRRVHTRTECSTSFMRPRSENRHFAHSLAGMQMLDKRPRTVLADLGICPVLPIIGRLKTPQPLDVSRAPQEHFDAIHAEDF